MKRTAKRAAWSANINPPADEQPLALDLSEIARRTRCSVKTLSRHIGQGRLKARKLGRRTVVLAEDLNSYLNNLPPATLRAR
jgi:excisionase family DNA binding protein